MEDIDLIKQLIPLLQAGGDVALIGVAFIAYKVWQALAAIDRRVMRVEIHLGIDPESPPPGGGRSLASRTAPLAAVALVALLGGCANMSGQVLGATVNVGGFTFGVSGAFPTGEALPPPGDDPAQ